MSCEYHTFSVIHEDHKEQVERCDDCGYKKVYKKIDERINNMEYLEDHKRDFAQPGGATNEVFQKYYGKN